MLEVDDNLLSSAQSIARFLAESGNATYLLGTNETEMAIVEQWTSWCSSEFAPSVAALCYATFG